MKKSIKAFPKINLCLYVGKKRSNGFHEISSIFQKIDNFYDSIEISVESSDSLSVSVFGFECPLEKNTAYIAADLFCRKTGLKAGIVINIEKGIPQKAGLGGGSSDAASVLLALNEMTGNNLSFTQLLELAEKIGSDVPFFMYDCKCASVNGSGEHVIPLKCEGYKVELEDSGYKKLGTGDAYCKLDSLLKRDSVPDISTLIEKFKTGFCESDFENDFENLYPPLKKGWHLSGSGSYTFKVVS